ncbi:MAG TPA: serine/threonine protein kinase, partial [Streptomyces sp.]|nr:serine/threonine protein kinase [Streptomyces sp.]
YPPPATDTYHLTPQGTAPAPAPAPPPRKSRRGLKAALIALVFLLVAGSGAAAAVYVLGEKGDSNTSANDTKDTGGNDAEADDKATPAPSPTESDTDSGTGSDGQDDTGGDGTTPGTPPTIPENAQYTAVFEDKAFTLRTPTADYTFVDFDEPEADTKAEMADAQRDLKIDSTYWYFETTVGKSSGSTPQECAEGTGTDALPATLDSGYFGEQAEIEKGTRLCTVTKSGNLAMWEITGLTPGDYSWEVPTVQGKLTLWKITE